MIWNFLRWYLSRHLGPDCFYSELAAAQLDALLEEQ